MTVAAFISGMITGVVLTLVIVSSFLAQGGPTTSQIMQMIPAYSGKDGCQ